MFGGHKNDDERAKKSTPIKLEKTKEDLLREQKYAKAISFKPKTEEEELEEEEEKEEEDENLSLTKDISEILIKNRNPKREKYFARKNEEIIKKQIEATADSEILSTQSPGFLEVEGEINKTFKVKQQDIMKAVDIQSKKKIFDLRFSFGSYFHRFNRNGRSLLLAGEKGHLILKNWKRNKTYSDFHVKQSIKDISFLHNETMFAVAQKRAVYIYDNKGIELHALKDHESPNKLAFLPHHFLLVSISNYGKLRYQDTSTGVMITTINTKGGPCSVMARNPANAVIHLGHNNGTVTMWTPNQGQAVVKLQGHKGPLSSLAVHPSGNYMITGAMDNQLKLWDIRNPFKELNSFRTFTPARALSISQLGLTAVGCGPHINVWKDLFTKEVQNKPYMTHLIKGAITSSLEFCPFEDVLGIGHSLGYTSILIPGSGEPNFDSQEANPYQTKEQRREAEVHSLLDKIKPEMITLRTNLISTIDTAPTEILHLEKMERINKQREMKKNRVLKKLEGAPLNRKGISPGAKATARNMRITRRKKINAQKNVMGPSEKISKDSKKPLLSAFNRFKK